jgi:MoaA/NifB/PqqE/SkfB family radical SAM enzyme
MKIINPKFTKTRNAVAKYIAARYKKFPQLLSVELTTICNSKCIMCPRRHLKRPLKHMSKQLFEKIIQDCIKKPLKKINFFWFGDPLCHPQITKFLRYARGKLKKTKFYVSTNAELLTKDKADEILSKKLLDVINFDIDGYSKQTYEKIRIGLDFDKVVRNVCYFIEKRKRLKLKKPEIRLTIIKMKQTEHEIEPFKKHWRKLADKVEVTDYNTWLGAMPDKNIGGTLEHSQKNFFNYPCRHPWYEMVIASDGSAGLCCLDYNLTAPLGNVKDKTIQQIWQGKTIERYRNLLLNLQYEKIAPCAKCNNYIYQDRTLWAKLWKK